MICPVCEERCGRRLHLSSCRKEAGLSVEDYTYSALNVTYPELKLSSKRKVEYLYVTKGFSIPDFKRLFGVKSRKMYFLLNYLDIPIRNLVDANASPQKKSKLIRTSRERYGVDNVLCRGTDSFHKRNKTVLERYGVENVFQLEEVKNRINEICLEKYGKLRITNPKAMSKARLTFSNEKKEGIARKVRETRAKWSKERREEYFRRRGEITRDFWKKVNDDFLSNKFLGKMNHVETKVSESMAFAGLEFKFSKFVCRRQFDFHVLGTKVLVEVQGDFWHANPSIYSHGETINLPGKQNTPVEWIWGRDKEKEELAKKHGYSVLQLWEKDVIKSSVEELAEVILNYVKSLRTSPPINSSTLT